MRMKGHAIHDAATYVPKEMHEFWRKRDCIDRFQKYLLEKKWLTPEQDKEMIASVEKKIDAEREFAESSQQTHAPHQFLSLRWQSSLCPARASAIFSPADISGNGQCNHACARIHASLWGRRLRRRE